MIISGNPFLAVSLEQIPRLLGQLNRNPGSASYGSFDRAFWHYRTNDISCCRYQEAVFTLALLYSHNFVDNQYYRDEQILEWLRASLRFIVSIQRPNGSFDEWYLNEGSFVGTAFLIAALSQTVITLKVNQAIIPEFPMIIGTIRRAARWLAQAKESTVMNQVAGAVFALAAAAQVTGNQTFAAAARGLEERLLAEQSSEGWWREYGGPDIGYLSLAISYLEKYQKLTGSTSVIAAILKATSFVRAFVNPDFTAGGEHLSRNTEYLIPSVALPYLGAIRPAHLDDRYLCYILYNWLETGLQMAPQTIEFSRGEDYFPQSALLRLANGRYFLVVGGKKGGAFRLYAGGRVYYDSGLELVWRGRRLSSGLFDPGNEVNFGENSLTISGALKPIKEPLMKTPVAIAFKTFQLLFGRLKSVQKLVKRFLRPRLISYRRQTPVRFERQVSYRENQVTITDIIKTNINRKQIHYGLKASYLAVPSAKYFTERELTKNRLTPKELIKAEPDRLIVTRTFVF